MNGSFGKLAPILMSFAMVGYCCWECVGEPRQDFGTNRKRLPQVTHSMLSPTIEPAHGRDPFYSPASTPVSKTKIQIPQTPDTQSTKVAATARDTLARQSQPQINIADAVNGLVLNGTFIQKNCRVAIINGHFYSPGDALLSGGESSEPFVVTHVEPLCVTVAGHGQSMAIAYCGLLGKQSEVMP